MALKALMLRKKIDGKKKELEALRVKAAELVTREAEIAKAIEEAESEEERAVVEEEVNSFEADKSANTAAADALEGEIRQLEEELEEEERSQDTSAPAPAADPEKREVKREETMRTRGFLKACPMSAGARFSDATTSRHSSAKSVQRSRRSAP